MAGAPKELWAVFTRLLKAFAWSLFLREKFKFSIANINRYDLTAFCELIKAGKITPVIDRRYPLAEIADAIAYAEEGHARAKVLITLECQEALPGVSWHRTTKKDEIDDKALLGPAGDTCGATFAGWTGGGTMGELSWQRPGHPVDPNQLHGTSGVAGPSNLVGGKWNFLFVNGLELRENVVRGTVTWPDEGSPGCDNEVNAASLQATLTVAYGGNPTIAGCLHDVPAGAGIPPTVWDFFNF
jgi:hypothetical protein